LALAGCATTSTEEHAGNGKKEQDMASSKRLAACGLKCSDCDQYKLPTDKAVQDRIIPYYRQRGWLGKDEGLEAVLEKKMYCKGCGDPDVCWSSNCKIMICCKQEKKLANCSECAQFPCQLIDDHKKSSSRYREAVEYLEAQRAAGA
jgi:hypothetical protein